MKLVGNRYYEYHNITYHITPDASQQCFHVKLKIDYKMKNKNLSDNNFEMKLKTYKICNFQTESDCKANFKMHLKINGEEINTNDVITVEQIYHNTQSTYYDYKIKIFKPLSKEENKILADIEYDAPIFDTIQSFRMPLPCKILEHKFYIHEDKSNGEKWKLQARAYSTFFNKQDDDNSNYKVEQNTDQTLIIRYNHWGLVGNGYCVFCEKII